MYAFGIISVHDLEQILNKPIKDKVSEKSLDKSDGPYGQKVNNPEEFKKYIKELIYYLDIMEINDQLKYDRNLFDIKSTCINNKDNIFFYNNGLEQSVYIEGIFDYTLEILKHRKNNEFTDNLLLKEFTDSLPKEVVQTVNRNNTIESLKL